MLPWMCSFFDLTLWVSVSGLVLRRDAVSEWARVILVVKFLQCIVACVLQPSMFTQITVRLVSPFVEQVAAWEVGESDTTFLLFGLLGWFRQLITRWWHWKRVVRFCHIYSLLLSPRGNYVTLSLVLLSFLVRSWFDTQDATLNVYLSIAVCENLFLDRFEERRRVGVS